MPILLDASEDLEALVASTRESMGGERPGIHVSSLISDIELKLGMKSSDPFPSGYLFAIAGIAWEGWVRSRLGEEAQGYIWQLEVEMDGVTGTLDALDTNTDEVIECKCTWTSAVKDPRDSWRYMSQVKAYCHMVGVNRARMYILHIQFPPVIKVARLEFTDQELEENWDTLLSMKESTA